MSFAVGGYMAPQTPAQRRRTPRKPCPATAPPLQLPSPSPSPRPCRIDARSRRAEHLEALGLDPASPIPTPDELLNAFRRTTDAVRQERRSGPWPTQAVGA